MPDETEVRILRWNLVVGLTGLLVGIGVLLAVLWGNIEASREDRFINAKIRTATNTSPNDSPVTVRGGSVIVRGNWTCPPGQNYCWLDLQSEPAELIALDGVQLINPGDDPNKDNSPHLINELVTTNWIVQFTFRQGKSPGEGEDPGKVLKLCTSDPTCANTGGTLGTKVYLVGDSNGTLKNQIKRDRDGVRYDLNACDDGSSTTESKCNHIHTVTVITGPSSNSKYHCIDGECTVSVGQ